jgi:CRISPR-associated protein Csx3
MTQRPVKVALCGPPHSGKSCLREGLKQALMVFHRAKQAPYPYVLTACPDGEGSWYSEAAQRDPGLARQLKQEYKAKFTWEFTHRVAANVRDIQEPLTIIDLGGLIDEKNRTILQHSTHAIILAGDMTQAPAWKDACTDLHVQVIALLHSNYEGTSDRIDSESPVVTGSIH